MADLTGIQARDGHGRSFRSPEQIAKDQQAAAMRSRSLTYQQIGDAMGVTRQAAYQAVLRAIADIPKEGAEEALALELEKLDAAERRLFSIIGKEHYRVGNNGKVVMYEDKPVVDDGPVVSAIGALMRVGERRAKLLGLNAPTKVDADVTLHEGMGEVDRAIWERDLEFDRWRTEQGIIDVDESPALGAGGEAGTAAS